MVEVWNHHLIRPSRNPNVPSGRPDIMYCFPQLYGTQDMKIDVDEASVDRCRQECKFRSAIPCQDADVYELCTITMSECNLAIPIKDPYECINLYLQLRQNIIQSFE